MPDVKRLLISETAARLAALGIPATCEKGADIVVSAELMEAGWSTGKKKITFEASILFDEAHATALMWQKTTEKSAGFSFGASGESSFQYGKTLYRKVRALQYGPEGKAYEYDLDLGAVTKAVEESARKYGWKFKTVLRRADASYPPGYTPAGAAAEAGPAKFCIGCGEPVGGNFCTKCGRKTAGE